MPWDYGGEADTPIWHDHPIKKYLTKGALKRAKNPIECLVSREEWGAVPPTSTERLRHNIPPFCNVPQPDFAKHIHFTQTNTAECFDSQECIKFIKGLQEKHMAKGETDILPSFLVGGDGKVYEGRGWLVQPKVPEEFQHFLLASLDFGFIGDFSTRKPPKLMIDAVKKVTTWAILNKKLYCCFRKTYSFDFHKIFWGQ